jgi:hypothetical protein
MTPSPIYFAYDDNGLTFFHTEDELINYTTIDSVNNSYILDNPIIKMDDDTSIILTEDILRRDINMLEIAREDARHPTIYYYQVIE